MTEYENAVRFAHLYNTEINQKLKVTRQGLLSKTGDKFIGMLVAPCSQPTECVVLIPAFYADSPNPTGVFICRSGQFKVYSVPTETGRVYEFVKE